MRSRKGFALADHVVKGVTGWIAILEAQIVGSKLPNNRI
jgi:hypothetical protein